MQAVRFTETALDCIGALVFPLLSEGFRGTLETSHKLKLLVNVRLFLEFTIMRHAKPARLKTAPTGSHIRSKFNSAFVASIIFSAPTIGLNVM